MADGPRHAKFFKDPRFREATRLIEVKLRIVSPDTLKFYRASDLTKIPGKVPPLCFVGSSKGVNGNEATVEGYVALGKDGIARWYFVSRSASCDPKVHPISDVLEDVCLR